VVSHEFVPREAISGARDTSSFEGRAFGSWIVLNELGRGGMGRVFLVERKSPHQLAALKILPGRAQGQQERRRFRREQEILARLEHPNIARFLDAGETSEGELYLVLERVEGEPIDVYCERKELAMRERIGLSLAMSRAVAAAHRQLIVHCDLKPSNVLVREDGVVKLLDFGLARPADPHLATETRSLSFSTWAYASPEQLAGKSLSTSSDVYSLGVLLFELVTKRQLFESSNQGLVPAIEARQKPLRLRDSGWARASGEKFSRRLEEDLAVVMAKALRPEPGERYGSVDELIADLEACLAGAPVAARRDDRVYALRRYLLRNAFPLSVCLFLVAVISFATLTLGLQTRKLRKERDQAREAEVVAQQTASYFLDLLEAPAPGERPGKLLVRDLANRAAERIETRILGAGLVRANVLFLLGDYYRQVGHPTRAMEFDQESLRIRQASSHADPHSLLLGLGAVALDFIGSGDIDEGCRYSEAALQKGNEAKDSDAQVLALHVRAICFSRRGDHETAEVLFSRAEALDLKLESPDSMEREAILFNLILERRALGRTQELEQTLRTAIRERLARRQWSKDGVTLNWVHELATLLVRRGELDEAEAFLREAREAEGGRLAIGSPILWDLHPAEVELQLAEIRRRRGDPQAALLLAKEAYEWLRVDLPPDSPRLFAPQMVIALALVDNLCLQPAKEELDSLLGELYLAGADPGDPEIQELEAARTRAIEGLAGLPAVKPASSCGG